MLLRACRISSSYQAGNICSQSPLDTGQGQAVLFVGLSSPPAITGSHPIAIYVGISGGDSTRVIINSQRKTLILSVRIPRVVQTAVTQTLHLHFCLCALFFPSLKSPSAPPVLRFPRELKAALGVGMGDVCKSQAEQNFSSQG